MTIASMAAGAFFLILLLIATLVAVFFCVLILVFLLECVLKTMKMCKKKAIQPIAIQPEEIEIRPTRKQTIPIVIINPENKFTLGILYEN